MKIALVHDYLAGYGGAERVLEVLHEMFPEAPIYTTVFLPEKFGPHRKRLEKWPIRTSCLQSLPLKRFLISPLRLVSPWVFGKWDFSEFDAVLVSATGAYLPNAVRTNGKTKHICYCHTPPRYLYGLPTAREWRKHWWGRVFGGLVNHFLRIKDFETAQTVDLFVANSREVAGRIEKFYRKKAKIVYPPVTVERFFKEPIWEGGYFLAGGRLARAKRVDLAVRVCSRLGWPLKVFGKDFAGYGKELRELAGSTVEFLGEAKEEELGKLFAGCRGYIFCSDNEDFGMIPVEVMASGRPVLAYNSGGVRETVVAGVTGDFFSELTEESLEKELRKFAKGKYLEKDCRERAKEFSREEFERKVKEVLANLG